MPSVSSRLSVAAVLAAAVISPALAQQTADASANVADVVVTGTRDPNVTARQSASPITIVSDAALRSTGLPDLRDAMVQLVPSLSRPLHGLDQASLVDSISLRGLTADQTLVLVNGKRRHPTGLRLAGSLRAALGASNLFNAYPSRLPAANSYIGAMRYDLASQQLGQDGGFYYLRLRLGG